MTQEKQAEKVEEKKGPPPFDGVPKGDRVVVLRELAADKTSGGLIIPEQAKAEQIIGSAVAVGPGRFDPVSGRFVKTTTKVGDRFLFAKYGGTKVVLNGQEYTIIREDEILIVLPPKKAGEQTDAPATPVIR